MTSGDGPAVVDVVGVVEVDEELVVDELEVVVDETVVDVPPSSA